MMKKQQQACLGPQGSQNGVDRLDDSCEPGRRSCYVSSIGV